jgi:hypothetical protein
MWKKLEFESFDHFQTPALQETLDFVMFAQNWNEIVGPTLGAYSLPFRIQRKNLMVATKHPMVAEQLSFKQSEILQKIRQLYPRLSKSLKSFSFQFNETLFLQMQASLEQKTKSPHTLHPHSPLAKKLRFEALGFFQSQPGFNQVSPEEQEHWISLYMQMFQT